MDVVLYSVQEITSFTPLTVFGDLALGLRKSACSLNQNWADENQNLRRTKLYKPPPIDIIRFHYINHPWERHEWDL
jgi:hypothetical protein